MQEGLRREVLKLYREVDQTVADAGPVCLASGRCCHFGEFDHELYLSQLEADVLFEVPPTADGAVLSDRCPYQEKNLCTARERRPLACRVYYCDPNYQETAQHISEYYLGRLKALACEHGLEWRYAPLHRFAPVENGAESCAPPQCG